MVELSSSSGDLTNLGTTLSIMLRRARI
jgi:hypothetical protein